MKMTTHSHFRFGILGNRHVNDGNLLWHPSIRDTLATKNYFQSVHHASCKILFSVLSTGGQIIQQAMFYFLGRKDLPLLLINNAAYDFGRNERETSEYRPVLVASRAADSGMLPIHQPCSARTTSLPTRRFLTRP